MNRYLPGSLILSLLLIFFLATVAQADGPTVVTDKWDYSPGETVLIEGSGFTPGATLTVQVIWPQPDGRVDSASVTAGADGSFAYAYALGLDGIEDIYTVNVLDAGGGVLASTEFLDSHFRFGHITWTRAPGTRDVTFRVRIAWRENAGHAIQFNFGDFTSASVSGTEIAQGTDSNGLVYDIHEYVVTHSYTSDGPYTAFYATCCRISGLQNASSGYFRIETLVNLAGGNQGSPVSSVPAILQMVQGGANTIPLAISDPDGDPLTCRMATTAESSISSQPSAGGDSLGVTSGCVLEWNTSGTTVGQQYAAQVIVEENHAGNTSSTALDFIIEITGGTLNQPPSCTLNGSASNILPVGQPFSLSATGSDPDGDPLTINHLGIPSGASLAPTAGTTAPSPFTGTFNWIPTPADAGSAQAVTLVFSDPSGAQAICSFSMQIPANQPPVAVDSAVTTAEDTAVAVTLSASDGDGDPLTYTLLSATTNGSLSGTAPNLTYTPNPNFHGSDSFTFKVNDGTVDSNIATVNITVNSINDDPTVTADTATVTVDEGQTANNSGTLGDVDGDSVTLSASVGSVTNNNDGTWSWSFASSDGPAESQTVTISADDGNDGNASVIFNLTVDNVAPTANAGVDQTVNRSDAVNVSGTWADPAGAADNAYTWAWDLDGDAVADVSNGTASYGDSANASTSFATEGVYTLTFSVNDKDGATASDSLTVTVRNVDPICTNAAPSVSELWPPNHSMVPISINGVTDAEGDAIAITIDSIFQDEPVDDVGDGSTAPDGAGIGASTAEVRAERAGGGNGRYYHISFTADDGHGGSCSGTVQVSVPKSQGKKGAAVDDGSLYDSTAAPVTAASLGMGEAVMQPWLFLPVVAGQ